ncbi:polysaccharide pyruvyl transferase WcaK-like protein [Rhodococcus sp. OK519]|uniref:polysaccharide pyruvyl transferase family protein n=1 Tax=Rhodococcus sp. OK519 TaxID=2135729 RepID=UPI000D4A9653|nr:polysaccharide pyruvyl transferase WcaK-like protein [Rhodococcus sp. OK519]
MSRIIAALKAAVRHPAYAHAVIATDNVVARVAGVRRRGSGSGARYSVCIVAPPGDGNIGDQALLESALDNTSESVVVIVRNPAAFSIPDRFKERTSVLVLKDLLYGNPVARLRDVWAFSRTAESSLNTWVIGADTMDGAYNPRASVARLSCAAIAARLGSQARVVGFSWNGHAVESATAALRRVQDSVQLTVRDPVSVERLQRIGVEEPTAAADLVFARIGGVPEHADVFDWVSQEERTGRRIMVVNVSALLQSEFSQADEYAEFLRKFDSGSWSFVFIPHVRRRGNDDYVALSEVLAKYKPASCFVLSDLLSPDQVFALARRSTLVVTGRMHLAVLSILAGTYPVTLASQGKVEGLYRLLSEERMCLSPGEGVGLKLLEVSQAVILQGLAERGVAESDLDRLREAALRNFE